MATTHHLKRLQPNTAIAHKQYIFVGCGATPYNNNNAEFYSVHVYTHGKLAYSILGATHKQALKRTVNLVKTGIL